MNLILTKFFLQCDSKVFYDMFNFNLFQLNRSFNLLRIYFYCVRFAQVICLPMQWNILLLFLTDMTYLYTYPLCLFLLFLQCCIAFSSLWLIHAYNYICKNKLYIWEAIKVCCFNDIWPWHTLILITHIHDYISYVYIISSHQKKS